MNSVDRVIYVMQQRRRASGPSGFDSAPTRSLEASNTSPLSLHSTQIQFDDNSRRQQSGEDLQCWGRSRWDAGEELQQG